MQKMFQVDIEIPAPSRFLNVGGRAYVRFDHGRAPLAVQGYAYLRRLFLSRFNVYAWMVVICCYLSNAARDADLH